MLRRCTNGHKQGWSHTAPYDPTETPGMKAVQQAIRLPASRHQTQTIRVIIPSWHLTPTSRLTFAGLI